MPDEAASPQIRERASLEVFDHSAAVPRKIREVDVVMVDGKVVERTESACAESLWAACRRHQRRHGLLRLLQRLGQAIFRGEP